MALDHTLVAADPRLRSAADLRPQAGNQEPARLTRLEKVCEDARKEGLELRGARQQCGVQLDADP